MFENMSHHIYEIQFMPDTVQATIQGQNITQAAIQGQKAVQGTVQNGTEKPTVSADLNESELAVLRCMQENPQITAKEISIALNWEISKAKYCISKLKNKNAIMRSGSSQKGSWAILL